MKRSLTLLLAGILLVISPRAQAGYVLFYRIIGDWTVVCSQEAPGTGRHCSLSAPPPALDTAGARNEVAIEEIAIDAFSVTVHVREIAPKGAEITLRVDNFAAHQGALADGITAWRGDEATLILREGLAGQFLVIGVQSAGGVSETRISLIGFSKAIETYRRVARSHGPL